MRVLLVDADSQKGFPNLVLMKLSAWHKARGDSIELIRGVPTARPLIQYDKVYISCIYFQNLVRVNDYALQIDSPLMIGGSGYDLEIKLEDEIEHILPDYSLYNVNFSMGFTSRGCVRRCPWCVVPQKEGKIKDHAPISEFLHPKHKRLVLLDNNFTASPRRYENLDIMREIGVRVNFNQGLDFRGLTKKFADKLSQVRFSTWRFNKRRVSFAFDKMSMEKHVIKGLRILEDAGISLSQIMVYVLVGFNTTIEEDLERFQLLRGLGVDPYIMRYNQNRGNNDILLHLSRWVNWRVYKRVDFADYDYCGSKESYKSVFGTSPDPTWGGYGCPQGGYAWANREYEEDDGQQTLEKRERA